ncbi:MAG: cyclic nucleotide-binding domain-containing protein [Candidatus Marinimicrobia bacterium]|nr:cyclic nucleotide-binding domain-containing protein [Candidatus Neomarinimicrobiota bacterium]
MIDKTKIEDFAIFKDLNAEQLDEVCEKLVERRYEENETIFSEGDVGTSLFLLLEGEVEITQALTLNLDNSETDNREKSLIRLNATVKTFFGEVGLIEKDGIRTATVRTTSNSSIARLSKKDFKELMEKDPVLGTILLGNIAEVLCQRLRTTNNNVLKITTAFSLALSKQ